MEYTFALFYKGADAKHRAKSAMVFDGGTIKEIMDQVQKFKQENPEYTIGAGIPGPHAVVP